MKALLFVTISTPKDSSEESVRIFLSNYLTDPYVISIPQPFRSNLVDGKIIPKRLSASRQRYQKMWDLYNGEMPLRKYTQDLLEKMTVKYPEYATYVMGFHAGEEEEVSVLERMHDEGPFESITLLPLYPQQTFSSYVSLVNHSKRLLKDRFPSTPISVVKPFYEHAAYIRLLADRVLSKDPSKYDILVASFHSIPYVHQLAGSFLGFNYKQQCEKTTRLLATRLNMQDRVVCCFQSAMGKKWIKPFIENEALTFPQKGASRLLLICPGFLSDCLETVYDLEHVLREDFIAAGGEDLTLVPSFNGDDDAVDFYYQLAVEAAN